MRPVVYILGLAALSCAWAAVASSVPYWLLLGAAVLASTHGPLSAPIPLRLGGPWPRLSAASVAIGLLAAAPPLVLLACTLGQELPFVGDHDHHLFQSEWSFRFLRFAIVPMAAAVTLLAWRPRRAVAIALALALFAASRLPVESTMFATRYPGLDHVAVFPLNALSHLTGWPTPGNVMRIAHALAVPVWLFVLRPVFIGRQPDAWALAAAFGFVWPAAAAYHFTTAYLEGPMLVLVALAAEASLRHGARGNRAALLFLGVAALFKEQAIFALPVMGIAGLVADEDGAARRDTARALVVALVPPALYFLARRHVAVWRGAGLLPLDRIFDGARIAQWLDGAYRAYGPTLLVLACGALVAVVVPRRGSRAIVVGWAAVIAVEIGFFYADSVSAPWTGYARFHLVPATVAAALCAELLSRVGPRARAAGTGLLALAALPTLVPLFARTRADTARNFYEHGDAPIFLPVRRGAGLLPPDARRARIVSSTGLLLPKYSIYALVPAYPDLAARIAWEIPKPGDFDPDACACAAGEPPRLALFVVFANRSEQHPERARIEAAQDRCLARMEATCTTTRTIPAGTGTVWGAVGY